MKYHRDSRATSTVTRRAYGVRSETGGQTIDQLRHGLSIQSVA